MIYFYQFLPHKRKVLTAMADIELTIRELKDEIERLNGENKELRETVDWMHDLIWQMLKNRP